MASGSVVGELGEDAGLNLLRRARDKADVHKDRVMLRRERPDSCQALGVGEPQPVEHELAVPPLEARPLALQEEVDPVGQAPLPTS